MDKEQGKHLCLPKAEYSTNWTEQYDLLKQGSQTAKTTMENLELKRTTFYKLVKQYENK